MPCEAHTTKWHEEGRDFQHCPMKTPDNPQKTASIPSVRVWEERLRGEWEKGLLNQPCSIRDHKK